MADVQLEKGYTRIANEILENILKLSLNGTQFRILLLIWRETYGFNRKESPLSESYIALRLGLQRQNIHREIKELFDRNLLITIHEATFTSSRIISFNKNYEEWQNGLHEAKTSTGIEYDSSTVIESDSSTGIELDSHRKKPLNKPLKKDMSEAHAPDSPTVIELILNDRTLFPISEKQTYEWHDLYPVVDIMQELRKMKGWLEANPQKRKTKRGILRFINSWLAREQDKGPKQEKSKGKEYDYLC